MATPGKIEYESFKEWILQLPDVIQERHRFGGTEFRIYGREFIHFHGYRHFDLRLSKDDQAKMLKEGKAKDHRYAPQAGWVTRTMNSPEDIETSKELVTLAYNNAREIMLRHKSRRSKVSTTGGDQE